MRVVASELAKRSHRQRSLKPLGHKANRSTLSQTINSLTMRGYAALSVLLLGASAQKMFNNPVLYQDLADVDIMRKDDTFYYSASTMHFSPGAPILRSYDLVNWEYFSHSVPWLDFSPGNSYNMSGGTAYNAGIYASFFNYNAQLKSWYWGGCITNDYKTHVYKASSPEGPWSKINVINSCYYDCGMLVDDDGTIYVVFLTGWNTKNLFVVQLSPDGKELKRQQVWTTETSLSYVEGWRMYKRGGQYYILGVHPMDGNIILKGSSPWGPYTWKWLVRNGGALVPGARVPRQGGLVSLPNGSWYHMAFVDAYPGGRLPALAPVDWSSDGWPTARLVNGQWGKQYPYPLTPRAVKSVVGTDTFNGTKLGPQYEWNHNPDPSAYSFTADGLQLRTATVTNNFFSARNTLTHRILGPSSTLTIQLDYSKMADGDRAGLVLFDVCISSLIVPPMRPLGRKVADISRFPVHCRLDWRNPRR
jgi:beta-xylosidase